MCKHPLYLWYDKYWQKKYKHFSDNVFDRKNLWIQNNNKAKIMSRAFFKSYSICGGSASSVGSMHHGNMPANPLTRKWNFEPFALNYFSANALLRYLIIINGLWLPYQLKHPTDNFEYIKKKWNKEPVRYHDN